MANTLASPTLPVFSRWWYQRVSASISHWILQQEQVNCKHLECFWLELVFKYKN